MFSGYMLAPNILHVAKKLSPDVRYDNGPFWNQITCEIPIYEWAMREEKCARDLYKGHLWLSASLCLMVEPDAISWSP